MKLPERQINEILTKIAINSVYGVLKFEKEEEPMPTNTPNDFIFKFINNKDLVTWTQRPTVPEDRWTEVAEYCDADVLATEAVFHHLNTQRIKKVIFNNPATIVFWSDGSKTVVKCGEKDTFDPEKGLAMAISKKFFDNMGYYYDVFKKWLPKDD